MSNVRTLTDLKSTPKCKSLVIRSEVNEATAVDKEQVRGETDKDVSDFHSNNEVVRECRPAVVGKTNSTMEDTGIAQSSHGTELEKMSNKDREKDWQTEPPKPERIENENSPCLQKETAPVTVKRNKNENPGAVTNQDAGSPCAAVEVSLTSKFSSLNIDGPKVESPESVMPTALSDSVASSTSLKSLAVSASSPAEASAPCMPSNSQSSNDLHNESDDDEEVLVDSQPEVVGKRSSVMDAGTAKSNCRNITSNKNREPHKPEIIPCREEESISDEKKSVSDNKESDSKQYVETDRKDRKIKNENPGTVTNKNVNSPNAGSEASLSPQFSITETDAPEVESQEPAVPTSMASSTSSTTSSTSLVSSTSSSSDASAPFMPSSSQSSLCDDTARAKDDLVILNCEADESDVFDFKNHLRSGDVGIPDIKVQLFSEFGFGQTNFTSLGCLPDYFLHILIYVTENLCHCDQTKFLHEVITTYNLSLGPNSKVTPVWTTEDKQKIPQLAVYKGLPFWRFKENRCPELYINNVKTLVRQIRS